MNRYFPSPGDGNYILKAQSSLPHVFVNTFYENSIEIKFYWKTATLIHVYNVCGCFHVPMAELSS